MQIFGYAGIEVLHLVLANDELVWVSWKFTAEERVPSLRLTQTRLSVPTSPRGQG